MWSRTLQSVNEKIGGADATKFAEEFKELERKVDVTNEMAESIVSKTKEYLQPNPALRMTKTFTKSKSTSTQAEGFLGESMVKYGNKLGEDVALGKALLEAGDAMKQLAEVKGSLENNVKQNFLEPIKQFQNRELKEVIHQRNEAKAKRLDFDSKRNKQMKQQMRSGSVSYCTSEVDVAQERFQQAYVIAETGMQKILENDVEQVTQLHAFAEEVYDYHLKCAEIMKRLVEKLYTIKATAASRPRKTYASTKPPSLGLPKQNENSSFRSRSPGSSEAGYGNRSNQRSSGTSENGYGNPRNNSAAPPSYSDDLFSFNDVPPPYSGFSAESAIPVTTQRPSNASRVQQPCCRALYDFPKESPTDLALKEGDIITLIRKVDESWYEGMCGGKTGFFPTSYVDIIVPLN